MFIAFLYMFRATMCPSSGECMYFGNFLSIFIAFLYMFRATMCLSSGENIVPMRHLVFVTLNQVNSLKLL